VATRSGATGTGTTTRTRRPSATRAKTPVGAGT
jgi:hypothetical protein